MVKPVTIKVDDALWKKVKKTCKDRGVLLTVAVQDALRRIVQESAA